MVEGETLLVLLFCARCQRSASAWQPDLLQEATVICNEQLHKKAELSRRAWLVELIPKERNLPPPRPLPAADRPGLHKFRDLYVECLPAGPE